MNKGRSRLVPAPHLVLIAATASLAAGCLGPPDLDGSADPLVVTEATVPGASIGPPPQRAAAIAEMRAKAEAGETMPFPDVYQAAQTTRLAARPEPKPLDEVATLQSELAAVAERLRTADNSALIPALKRREAELRRLLAAAQAGVRRRQGRR